MAMEIIKNTVYTVMRYMATNMVMDLAMDMVVDVLLDIITTAMDLVVAICHNGAVDINITRVMGIIVDTDVAFAIPCCNYM